MLYTTKLKPILSNPAKIFSFPLAIFKQMCYNITVICTDCIMQSISPSVNISAPSAYKQA